MRGEPGTSLGKLLARLAALDVADWRGLPYLRLGEVVDTDAPAAAMLGAAFEPADVVWLGTPPSATGARAWVRDGHAVLVDVALETGGGTVTDPPSLGEPERRLDVTYGLRHLPSGEWIYAARGLAFVVDDDRVRHVMGFEPCDEEEYVNRLRVRFETTRRPLASGQAKEEL